MSKKDFVHSEYGPSSVVLSMPHSGNDIFLNLPDAVLKKIRFGSEAVRRTLRTGVDSAVPEMTGFHERTEHSRVWTEIPRAIVNVNSSKREIHQDAVSGGTNPLDANGLIFTRTVGIGNEPTEPMLVQPYTQEELRELLAVGYSPYTKAIKRTIKRTVKEHGFSITLDLHTFPANATRKGPSGEYVLDGPATVGTDVRNGKLPDLILICNPDERGVPRSCHPVIKEVIENIAGRAGLVVMTGFGPFQGDKGSTVLYGDRSGTKPSKSGRRHVVGLELVSHQGLEEGRDIGKTTINQTRALELMVQFYKPTFKELASMTRGDLGLE